MTQGKALDRTAFLAQADVCDFIDWLVANLPRLDVHLRFAPSRFVPGGLDQRVRGIQDVLHHYHWANSWFDYQNSVVIQSDDWASTTTSLLLLRDRLQTALNVQQSSATVLKACEAVLTWGGVRGALPFLRRMDHLGQLVNYLQACQPLFSLTGGQNLAHLNASTILRFDAGLTKIHALADSSGSPIYDSRVGAAIAMLYALYQRTASAVPALHFASGSARGQQVRNPGDLGFARAPQFFTAAVPAARWAQCQVELGWILRETLKRSPRLVEGSSVEGQCHALEAALFMIGYDLNCLALPAQPTAAAGPSSPVQHASQAQRKTQAAQDKDSTWVPTSVPFVQLLQEYLACSEAAGRTIELAEFHRYQLEVKHHTQGTARAYCSPFKETELDLPNCSLQDLKLIAQGGERGLQALGGYPYISGDEREQIYLVNAFLAGRCPQIATSHGMQTKDLLVQAGFAGKHSSAGLILRVGNAVGQHFGLLSGGQPTPAFEAFFGNALQDLECQLREAAAAATASQVRFAPMAAA